MNGKAKCKKCGKELKVDSSKILTSNPPKYEGKCEHCKEISYYELHEISWEFENVGESNLYIDKHGLNGPKDNSITYIHLTTIKYLSQQIYKLFMDI